MSTREASTEVADWMHAHALPASARRLLVVALDALDLAGLPGTMGDCTAYRLPRGGADASREPWLPYDDAAFDCVVLYRLTSHSVDIQLLLGEAARVLGPQGRVVVLEHQTDFAFAPLPEAGAAHLLHGWLREAGFAQVDIAERAGTSVIAVAQV